MCFPYPPPTPHHVADNSEGIGEVFDMIGMMYIAALEMLHECDLIGPTPPLPDNIADNIGVMILHFLDFMMRMAANFHLTWVHESFRAADACGINLSPLEHISDINQGIWDSLKKKCGKSKKKPAGFAWQPKVS